MSEVKHTQTPWVLKDEYINTEYGRLIAATDGSDLSWQEDEANAAHIVKCVNLHDELVEALERARQYMKDEFNNVDDTGEEFSIVEHMEAVLKKAGAL